MTMDKFTDGRSAVEALPLSLRVGVLDWKVERWAPVAANAARCYGQCSASEQTIRIDLGIVSAQKVANTTLHEIGHAIYYQQGIEDEDKEERIVRGFANGWTQVFRDNPDLLTWLARCV